MHHEQDKLLVHLGCTMSRGPPQQLTFKPAAHFQAVIVQSGQSGSKDSRKYQCGMQYSWYWVVIFLQLVALLIGLAAQFTNKKSRSAAMAMYSTVTALW